MKIQVLVATMHQTDYSLPEKMNLRTDAIIGNQCDRNSVEEINWNNHTIRYYNFAEYGVGLNRNNILMRATADICLFADDDMIYQDDYADSVCDAFKQHPDADVLIFNLIESSPSRYVIKKKTKVGYLNYLRYGTARIAIKLKSIRENGIFFNLCYGGGTEHCHGEDNLFLTECLRKGLTIYALPIFIARLTEERNSTWNKGYDSKFFFDQGDLYRSISKHYWKLLCLQDAIRHRKTYNDSILNTYRAMTMKRNNDI